MDLKTRSSRSLTCLVPLLAVMAVFASCSSGSPGKSASKPGGALRVPVTVPANCKLSTTGSPTSHSFIGLEATTKSGVTEKQVSAAVGIPNSKTMPCASGANYVPGPPVGVDIAFLKGTTVADQDRAASTLRSSGLFSVVTVEPQPS
jgi:hypothetical protein